jgi:hypothetical protein
MLPPLPGDAIWSAPQAAKAAQALNNGTSRPYDDRFMFAPLRLCRELMFWAPQRAPVTALAARPLHGMLGVVLDGFVTLV